MRLVNYKEFGKVYVKTSLDSDLEKHRIIDKKEFDEPFSFPNDSIFQEHVASFLGEKDRWTLREILERLENTYSGKTGI